MKNPEFIYLVFCNVNPLVYGVYYSKQKAVRYAVGLIRFRRNRARDRNWAFGYYHFNPYVHRYVIERQSELDSFESHESTIFSVCIKCKDGLTESFTDEGCRITVVRRKVTQ